MAGVLAIAILAPVFGFLVPGYMIVVAAQDRNWAVMTVGIIWLVVSIAILTAIIVWMVRTAKETKNRYGR